jgi:hypothetical protein
MTEKARGKSEAEKKKRRKKKGVDNLVPAEEPVKGPSGEDIYRVK